MARESKLERTEHGLVPRDDGWFVLNMRDAEWRHAEGRGAVCAMLDDFEGEGYARVLTQVTLEGGTIVDAQVYELRSAGAR